MRFRLDYDSKQIDLVFPGRTLSLSFDEAEALSSHMQQGAERAICERITLYNWLSSGKPVPKVSPAWEISPREGVILTLGGESFGEVVATVSHEEALHLGNHLELAEPRFEEELRAAVMANETITRSYRDWCEAHEGESYSEDQLDAFFEQTDTDIP